MKNTKKRRAVFLYRDGTIIKYREVPIRKKEIRLLPGAAKAIARLHRAGFLIIVITNQPVVARGLISEEGVHEIHLKIDRDVRKLGGHIDAFYSCFHHPEAPIKKYRKECSCRKPGAGMLKEAAKDWNIDLKTSVMIGDSKADILAGHRAGTKAISVTTGPGHHSDEKYKKVQPDAATQNLKEATDLILGGTFYSVRKTISEVGSKHS